MFSLSMQYVSESFMTLQVVRGMKYLGYLEVMTDLYLPPSE